MHHACHVYVEFLCQQVLKVAKQLQISDLLRLDSRHLNAEAEFIKLIVATVVL